MYLNIAHFYVSAIIFKITRAGINCYSYHFIPMLYIEETRLNATQTAYEIMIIKQGITHIFVKNENFQYEKKCESELKYYGGTV